MQFENACQHEVLWKLWLDFEEIDAFGKQDSWMKKGEVWSQLLEFCPATATELNSRRVLRLTFRAVNFLRLQ